MVGNGQQKVAIRRRNPSQLHHRRGDSTRVSRSPSLCLSQLITVLQQRRIADHDGLHKVQRRRRRHHLHLPPDRRPQQTTLLLTALTNTSKITLKVAQCQKRATFVDRVIFICSRTPWQSVTSLSRQRPASPFPSLSFFLSLRVRASGVNY